jgi:hypothetical protein
VPARDLTDANALVAGGRFWHGQSARTLGTGITRQQRSTSWAST